jgi:putative FmdB family regulatory protein
MEILYKMPTYEYICNKCEHQFDHFQSMKDEPLKTCPVCKENTLKRLIGSGAGIIFKGSGFYCTDYRSDNYNSAKQQAKKPTSATGKSKTSKAKVDKSKKTAAV